MKRKELINRLIRTNIGVRWMICDLLMGLLAFTLGFVFNPHHSAYMPTARYMITMGLAYGFVLMISAGACGISIGKSRFLLNIYEFAAMSVMASLVAYLLFNLLLNLLLLPMHGRYVVTLIIALSAIGLMIPRLIVYFLMRMHPINIMLYGAGVPAKELLRRIGDSGHFKAIGILDDDPAQKGQNFYNCSVLGDLQSFSGQALRQLDVDLLVICHSGEINPVAVKALFHLPLEGVEILTKGAFIEHYFREITVEYTNPHWVASFHSIPALAPIFFAKRLMDIFGALLGLCLSSPLWLLISPAIKLTSRGPLFYRQKRVGYRGKEFSIIKFRTMVEGAEKAGAQWARSHGDPRITKAGAFLRRTRLDELPQLLNILSGDMSIVGPRPERPEFVNELVKEIPFYEYRLMVPPGLTGWAQICYRYGSSKEDARKKLQYDLYYVRNISLIFDLQIILKTIPLIMKGSR